MTDDVVTARQPGVRQGVRRVFFDCLVEICQTLFASFRCELVQVKHPLEICLIRLGVDPAGAGKPCLFCGRHRNLDLPGNGPSHLALQRQYVTQVSLVAVNPEVRVRRRMDQLRCDPHLLGDTHHRTFHHRIHIQLSRNLRQRPLDILVLHDRCPRPDLQRPDLGQVGDQRLGHPVGEVLLLRVAGEVLQRQYCQRLDMAGAAQQLLPPPAYV